VVALKKTIRADHKLHELDSVVVGGKRRVRRENSIRHSLDHRFLEVEELVDHEANSQLVLVNIASLSELIVRDA